MKIYKSNCIFCNKSIKLRIQYENGKLSSLHWYKRNHGHPEEEWKIIQICLEMMYKYIRYEDNGTVARSVIFNGPKTLTIKQVDDFKFLSNLY